MKIIALTNLQGKTIYINPDHIGHMYEVEDKIDYGRVMEPKHTKIGVTTHNNGGFQVKESAKEIIKKISTLGS
jgi:uncharacterized protein YlzI (FlbEa/FlbD family)